FAHGGGLYFPRHDARSAGDAVAKAVAALTDGAPEAIMDSAMAILAVSELEPDELAGFTKTVAETAGLPVQAVKERIKKERGGSACGRSGRPLSMLPRTAESSATGRNAMVS